MIVLHLENNLLEILDKIRSLQKNGSGFGVDFTKSSKEDAKTVKKFMLTPPTGNRKR